MGNEYIKISTSPNKNDLYARMFEFLMYKKEFDEEILTLVDNEEITNEIILKLFAIYSKDKNLNVKNFDEKK